VNFYAIAHKGFIEVVRSTKPPVRKVTYLTRKYQRGGDLYFDWDTGTYQQSKRTTITRRIPVISYSGRYKTLASKNPRQFGKLTGHTLRPGTIWKLSAEVANKLIAK
jgi:hypothetical protein